VRPRAIARAAVEITATVALFLLAAVARVDAVVRRLARRRPRVVWGPTPIINIKYWSEAVRAQGLESKTVVDSVYPAFERSDFDHVGWRLGGPLDFLSDYLMMARLLLTTDVFSCFFDGGFLRNTRGRDLELPLLRLAGRKVVVLPVGSDIAVPGYLGPWERAMVEDYPQTIERGPDVRRRVLQFSRWATTIIRTLQIGFMPRWDVFWGHGLAIDTDEWRNPTDYASPADGTDGAVRIVHAPNHRRLKGTQHLLDAVERLRAEGLLVELDLLERRSNREVRAAVMRADVVADQFLCGFGLFAVEGLSAGKPVLSRIGWMPPEILATPSLRECPIVDADAGTVADRLRELVTDPELRARTGEAGRAYATKYHSYETVGAVWRNLFEHAWAGRQLEAPLVPAVDLVADS
jgi:glycosyltransferase involved in cell wall biosynthesis